MSTIIVSLSDIILDPKNKIDLTALPINEAIELIKQSYGFLSTAIDVKIENGIAIINLPEEKSKRIDEAVELFKRGNKKAQRGDYKSAIQLFKRTLEILPAHTDARRNLAMAYLESGNQDEALNHLIDVLRLNPKDVWGLLLLGNIYSKYKNDFDSAEPFYKKAYEINPHDPYLLNNYAALKIDKGEIEESERMFRESIEADPRYPNSSFGLALLCKNQNKFSESLKVIEKFFSISPTEDSRAKAVIKEIRSLYLQVHKKNAENEYESLMAFVHSRGNTVESITGFPVEFTEDNSLKGVTAKIKLAWKHHASRHQILYLPHTKEILPHILIHELEHILLEHEARIAKNNKTYLQSEKNRKGARSAISDDILRLIKTGYKEDEINDLVSLWIDGLVNQIYNNPLDMIVEKRIFDNYEILRSSQFVSLHKTQQDILQVITNDEIGKITPRIIYRSNQAMNCAYALFTDWLYNGATEYSVPFNSLDTYRIGQNLFNSYLQEYNNLRPGDEYSLIRDFAKILKLEEWFSIEDDLKPDTRTSEGPTNPELLKAKEPEIAMYCLDTLKRFENLSQDKIREITSEVGMFGMNGIDYTKPDKRYSLKSLPGEQFSGLQLLVFMYVGFKMIDPTVNTGLDFEDAYQTALKLFEA